jgi:hypothetical protein
LLLIARFELSGDFDAGEDSGALDVIFKSLASIPLLAAKIGELEDRGIGLFDSWTLPDDGLGIGVSFGIVLESPVYFRARSTGSIICGKEDLRLWIVDAILIASYCSFWLFVNVLGMIAMELMDVSEVSAAGDITASSISLIAPVPFICAAAPALFSTAVLEW